MLGTLGGAQGSHVRGQGEFAVRPGGQKKREEGHVEMLKKFQTDE
jgi:hypothetical protein